VAAIRAIPEGFVRTYGDVSPGAPRFTGHVLRTLHAPDIPWWRVVRADGSLAAGDEQRARLEAEGVPFRPGAAARVDLRIARMTGAAPGP
jgi:methylated-DNA-protein-cysteine methyltransferase-like protein